MLPAKWIKMALFPKRFTELQIKIKKLSNSFLYFGAELLLNFLRMIQLSLFYTYKVEFSVSIHPIM